MTANSNNSSEEPLKKTPLIDSKITSDGIEKTNIIRNDLLLKIVNLFQIKNLKDKDSISILKKYFGERIKKTIEVVFTKELRGNSEINKILLNKYSDGKKLNEHFFTKLNRYYPMYEEYIFKRFSNEIEKEGNENLNEKYIIELMKNIINDFIKVIYVYGDKLSPVKFEKIFLDKELLNETYNKTLNIYKNRYKYPDLIEMYRHLAKQELKDEKIPMSESIENHFKSTLISLIDIFIHWKNSPGLEEDVLKEIILEIKRFLNYSYILYKNNFAFGSLNPDLVRIQFRNKLIDFFEAEIKNNLNMDEVKQFKELLTNNGKIELNNIALKKYIEGFKGSRKEKNIEQISEKTITSLAEANILTFIELSAAGSTTRIKLFINNILNIGKKQEVEIINPFLSSDNVQMKNNFIEFYIKKHRKHNIGVDYILSLLNQAFITFDEKVKSKPLNEQSNLLYKFIEEDNELFQILISWWRYTLMHKEFSGDKGKILKADINIYGTKELILSELEGTGIDVNIINGELSNGSAWPINRMLELHRKKFTHGPIKVDNQEEFGLGEKGLIKNHIELYTIDEYNIADEGVDELMLLLSNEINNSNNISFKTNFKIYSNHIKNIFTSNFTNEEDNNSKITRIISRLPQEQQKDRKDLLILFMYCIKFQKRNNEIIKLHRIREGLKNRMEICNSLLAKNTNFVKNDEVFVKYLTEKIGCLKVSETGEKLYDLDYIWKIRRFLKYTINISADLEKMIKKGEDDRTELKQLSAKKFKKEIGENNKIIIGPRKKISRLLIKLMESYNGDLREIGDITRMRIVSNSFLESINAIKKFITSIHNHLDITQLVIEDKTGNPYERAIKPTGYRDVSLVLRLDSKNIIEIQFIIESIANFKNGIKVSELLPLFKNNKIIITDNEFKELLYQAKRLNKYLPEELLALYEGEIKKEDKICFRKGLILSSDDFYDLWRESKNKKFRKKMQFMESLPNKDAWAKIVTDTLKTIL